jgi:serine/threonine protein kinase
MKKDLWLPRNTIIEVSIVSGGHGKLEILERVPGDDQIGYSYKAKWLEGYEGSTEPCFLKIPDPVPDERLDELRARFRSEMLRGSELNELIESITKVETEKEDGARVARFKVPQYRAGGVIESVNVGTSENTIDTRLFERLPVVTYEWIAGTSMKRLGSESKWLEFAEGLADAVRRLHNHGFIHANIAPRNILVQAAVNSTWHYLAGFGYATLATEGALGPRVRLDADKPYQAPELRENRSIDALWHPADIYSVGAVLYYAATGEIPTFDVASGGTASVKRFIREKLPASWSEMAAKIIDNCLRASSDERIETAEELLELIRLTRTKFYTKDPLHKSKIEKKPKDLGPFFSEIIAQEVRELTVLWHRIAKRRHHELYGSRTQIIHGLCLMLARLPRGAVYRTVTLPSYWTENNLGPDGRFLAMNRHVSQNGVRIERIFLVSGPFHSLSDEEQNILRNQSKGRKEQWLMEVKVLQVPNDVVLDFERSGQAVAFISFGSRSGFPSEKKIKKGMFLCLNFISRGQEHVQYGKRVIGRRIRKVRIWDPGLSEQYWKRLLREANLFRDRWTSANALPVMDYINPRGGTTLSDLLARSPGAPHE